MYAPSCTKILPVGTGPRACPYNGQPQGVVPTMSLLESNHRMHQNIRRLQGPRACPYNGQPQGVVPTMSLLESGHRMHQNIRRLQGPRACPYNGQPQRGVPTMSLSDVVHRFKSLTTRKYINGVKNSRWAPFRRTLWQRSFYDHIIRNDKDLTRVREYIQNNPINWALDKKNLDNFTEST